MQTLGTEHGDQVALVGVVGAMTESANACWSATMAGNWPADP
jgi:hypothetical protein